MLIRRELSILQTLLRVAGILAIAVAAFLVWYLNPVRSVQRSTTPYVAIGGPIVTPVAIPKDIFTDTRLQDFEPRVIQAMLMTFGREDPFAPIAPTAIAPVPSLEQPKK